VGLEHELRLELAQAIERNPLVLRGRTGIEAKRPISGQEQIDLLMEILGSQRASDPPPCSGARRAEGLATSADPSS
jgi:hypothetical protein